MYGQFKFLFSPLKIGNTVVPNRISFSAHLTNFAEHELPTVRHIYYLAERAKGGAGLIITEEQSVHPTDHAYEKLIDAFNPAVVPLYRKLCNAVHAYETRIFAQLNHNGAQSDGSHSRLPVWAPSPVPDVLFREVPKEMEPEDIRELIEYYRLSASNVRQGGFDGIELQLGHSSLLRQFMSPLSNQRTDDYGGSLEKRMRLAIELVGAMRKAAGERFLLLYRHSAVDGEPQGATVEESIQLGKALETHGLDILDVSAGRGQKDNLSIPESSAPEGTHADLAGRMKAEMSIPVIAVGRIQRRAVADGILREGKADLIALGRQLLADPFWPQKLQEGREGEIVLCTYCNSCSQEMRAGRPISCPQNPNLGKEAEE